MTALLPLKEFKYGFVTLGHLENLFLLTNTSCPRRSLSQNSVLQGFETGSKAGIQKSLVVTALVMRDDWIPAFAGMTCEGYSRCLKEDLSPPFIAHDPLSFSPSSFPSLTVCYPSIFNKRFQPNSS